MRLARKTRDQRRQLREKASWEYWRFVIRNPKFWEDLNILNDKLLLFHDCASANSEKFRDITARRLVDYETCLKRAEDRWEISPIPTWAVLFAKTDKPRKPQIKNLEEMYKFDKKQRPGPYHPVQVIGYHPVEDFLDVRVDLTQPLYILLDQIETEIGKFSKRTHRKRLESGDLQLAVFDLVQYDQKRFSTIARELRKSVSTIRSAYLAARRKFGITEKKDASTINPGPIPQCSDTRCRSAERPEDFCKTHREWAEQDQVYLREHLTANISSIEHARAKGQV